MNAIRCRLQHLAWLAIVSMLALVLLPTVAHALSAASGSTTWAEICTPQGMRVVAVDQDSGDPAAPVSTAGHLEHCLYCAQQTGAPGLPPAAAGFVMLPRGPDALPALFFHAPRPLFAWAAAQARAPPVVF